MKADPSRTASEVLISRRVCNCTEDQSAPTFLTLNMWTIRLTFPPPPPLQNALARSLASVGEQTDMRHEGKNKDAQPGTDCTDLPPRSGMSSTKSTWQTVRSGKHTNLHTVCRAKTNLARGRVRRLLVTRIRGVPLAPISQL
jgi:hypothetical protein